MAGQKLPPAVARKLVDVMAEVAQYDVPDGLRVAMDDARAELSPYVD